MSRPTTYDAIVIGGGPSGATAACDLVRHGRSTLLLDRAGRIKPCGGAIPPRLMRDFDIPESLLVARIKSARMVSPTARAADMEINIGGRSVAGDGFVGMVDRDVFDEWLRARAAVAGAVRVTGTFERIERNDDGTCHVHWTNKQGERLFARARAIVGADGARSAVARQSVEGAEKLPCVFAYHEIVRAPLAGSAAYDRTRCDVYYDGRLSPDFYSWIFPHGDTCSIGTGSMHKGFSLRDAVGELRQATGLDRVETVRREGAPIPLHPLPRWDDGRNVVLAGDAAGVVAPASGEGIFYAMLGGRLAADSVDQFLESNAPQALQQARKRFMLDHGKVFWMLGLMQKYWYANDGRRERFVSICRDRDVQQLTWDAYMNKELVRARPLAHVRIFFKNIAHLSGLVSA